MGSPHLFSLLEAFASPSVFNPWRDTDALDFSPSSQAGASATAGELWPTDPTACYGPAGRLIRLKAHFDCKPMLMLVGEAPGFQGARFSGVPFTNEKLILQGTVPRIQCNSRISTRQIPWCEPSATIVWDTLHRLGIADRTVLWNSFAWHPHEAGEPYSNRAPTPAELAAGLPVLRAVIEHFDGVPVVPVGKIAAKTLANLGVKCLEPVRHPARGGATDFRAQLTKLVKAFTSSKTDSDR